MQYHMTQPVYLVIGVPGSGKTWVCEQLTDRFHYIPHDQYYGNHVKVILKAIDTALKPIITEVPFGERLIRDELKERGATVHTYFVIIEPETARRQYEKREGKKYPKNFFTLAKSMKTRAQEWMAPFGDSHEILALLKAQ